MSLTETLHLLLVLGIVLTFAHLGGRLFARFRQPPVIGEILGGLLLGPSVLGLLAPGAVEWINPSSGAVASALAAAAHIGLLLLMMLAGAQLPGLPERVDGRTVLAVTVVGICVPFAVGVAFARMTPDGLMMGTADHRIALILVIAVSVAVTSIPVISRILMDLGLMGTWLARTVLAVAVLEDVVLTLVISLALGLVGQAEGGDPGLAGVVLQAPPSLQVAYHVAVPAALLVVALVARRRLPTRLIPGTVAGQLGLLVVVAAACVYLGVPTMLGALLVGLVVGVRRHATAPAPTPADAPTPDDAPAPTRDDAPGGTERRADALAVIGGFASATFVPLYFAVVGLRLDLAQDLDLVLTAVFVTVACATKLVSVWVAARWAGTAGSTAIDLAIALNARGGPGIVVATLSYEAGIVNAEMFTTLVITAIVTSQAAGSWLGRVAHRHLPLDRADGRTVAPRPQSVNAE